MAVNIDDILENYEKDLENAKQGKCKKITWCTDFKEALLHAYNENYKTKLERIKEKLIARGHSANVEEESRDEIFYGFSFSLIPRHLLSGPIDRFFPSSIKSSISFKANEHTLTVDVETALRPVIDRLEGSTLEKIPRNEFSETLLLEQINTFIEKVFNETISVDFNKE
jgi:hypothetical protein